MKPDVERLLQVAAGHLLTRTAPELPEPYAQSSVGVIAVLLGAVGEEFERAAARRAEENRALRNLFEAAAPLVTDPVLREGLAEAAGSKEGGLRISELAAENDRLRALLIELHAHVEELPGAEARRLEDAIWSELACSTERRRLALGPF